MRMNEYTVPIVSSYGFVAGGGGKLPSAARPHLVRSSCSVGLRPYIFRNSAALLGGFVCIPVSQYLPIDGMAFLATR